MLPQVGDQGIEDRGGRIVGMLGPDFLHQGLVALPETEAVTDPHPEAEVVIQFGGLGVQQGFERPDRQALEAELDRRGQRRGIVFLSGHKVRLPKVDRCARARPRYLHHCPLTIYEQPPYLP